MIKQVVCKEPDELAIDADHLGQVLMFSLLTELEQMFCDLNIDLQGSYHLMVNRCIQGCNQPAFFFFMSEPFVNGDVFEGDNLAILTIKVEAQARDIDLSV